MPTFAGGLPNHLPPKSVPTPPLRQQQAPLRRIPLERAGRLFALQILQPPGHACKDGLDQTTSLPKTIAVIGILMAVLVAAPLVASMSLAPVLLAVLVAAPLVASMSIAPVLVAVLVAAMVLMAVLVAFGPPPSGLRWPPGAPCSPPVAATGCGGNRATGRRTAGKTAAPPGSTGRAPAATASC